MSSSAAASPPVTSDHGSDGTARSNYTLMYIIIAVLVGVVLYVVIRYGRSVMAEYRQLQADHGAARRVRVGLTTEEIAALPTLTYRVRAASASPLGRRSGGKGTAAECVVCLQDLEDGDVVRVLPSCRHFFHGGCIDVWLRAHSSCPVCRADLDPECERLREEVAVSRRVAGAALLRVEGPGGHPGTVAVEVSDSEGVRQGGRPVDEAAIASVIRDYDCQVQDAVAHDEVQQAALVSFSDEHWSAGKCGSDYLGVVGASGAGDRDCQVHDAVAGKVKQSAVSKEHRSGGKYGSITLASPSPTATGEGGSGSLSKSSSPVHIQ